MIICREPRRVYGRSPPTQPARDGENVDPLRLTTELHDHVGILEVGGAEAEPAETEVVERLDDPGGVVRVGPDPDVEVLGGARVTVGSECVAADDQEADVMIDE